MKITAVEAWLVDMRLVRPYTAAYDTIETTANVFLRLVTDRRTVGYGCAAPAEHDTGESPDTLLAIIRSVVEPTIKGADPLRPALLHERLHQVLAEEPSLRAAVDMALWDIYAKKCDVPLWKLLGGYRDRIATSVTVGILPEKEAVAKAREWAARGFSIIKLKGGLDAQADVARVFKIREALGEHAVLRFDANEGYDVEQALWFIDQTRPARIEILEQPTPKGNFDLLGQVTRRADVPVMADESLTTLRDAFRLTAGDLVDMLNVKLMKVGGIAEATEINSVAKAAGAPVMIGCMDESALGIAAALSFALSDSNVAYADLDGHLDLTKDDPAAGAVEIQGGMMLANERPGLGVELSA